MSLNHYVFARYLISCINNTLPFLREASCNQVYARSRERVKTSLARIIIDIKTITWTTALAPNICMTAPYITPYRGSLYHVRKSLTVKQRVQTVTNLIWGVNIRITIGGLSRHYFLMWCNMKYPTSPIMHSSQKYRAWGDLAFRTNFQFTENTECRKNLTTI